MPVSARLKGYRVSAQKARLLANEIRGKGVDEALMILDLSPKGFARPLAKLVRIVEESDPLILGKVSGGLVLPFLTAAL